MTTQNKKTYQQYAYLNSAPIAILIADCKSFKVGYANEKALSWLFTRTEDPVGLTVSECLPGLFSAETLNAVYERCFAHGQTFQKTKKHVIGFEDKNPEGFWVNINVQPVKDVEGTVKEFIFYLTDEQGTSGLSQINDVLVAKNAALSHTHSLLQQLIDSSIEYIAVIDRDLNFLTVNKAFEKFVNKSREDLVGKHIFEAYQGARGTRQVELLQKALAGEAVHLKVNPSISRPNDVWFDTHYIPLTTDGSVEGVIVLSRDITDIVESEQRLSSVNRQLAEAQTLSKLGSWEWDLSTGNIVWSDEMYRIYGYDEKFAVDFVKATERMSPEDAERSSRRTQQNVQLAMDNFKRTGALVFDISSIEFAINLPGDVRKVLRSSGKIQLTPEGKLHRVLGAVQDVTEIKSAEERLRLLIEELESKNSELQSFNFVASHDLQEPLRKIQLFIDRIRGGSLTQQTIDDYLSRIDNSARRMARLIQSLLTLSSLSKHEDEIGDVDLNVVVDHCKTDFERIISEKNATIQTGSLPVIRGSEFQIRQLFGNLINNSLKFCSGDPQIRIACRKVKGKETENKNAQPDKDYWCLTFSDNGIGFDPQYKEKIFELFQRIYSRQQFAGTGIGLNIVKRVVERHKGFIEATSEPGKGARFDVWLPC